MSAWSTVQDYINDPAGFEAHHRQWKAQEGAQGREEETMTEKRCPMLVIANCIPGGGWSNPYCIGEYCAWWNEDFECCGLIAQGVIWGLELARKESHEGQEH